MGLLSLGTPLDWEDAKKYAESVRQNGIDQFLHVYNNLKDRKNDELLWGDEIEYNMVKFDHKNKTAKLVPCIEQVIEKFESDSVDSITGEVFALWRPEYARYMIEGTPGLPYRNSSRDYLKVEKNMVRRREVAQKHMETGVRVLTITSFPHLGVPGFTTLPHVIGGSVSKSIFLPDEIINLHSRFPTLTANIRKRRGEKVSINVPLFKDRFTKTPFLDEHLKDLKNDLISSKPDHIYMDAMGFGMGCSCLQVTIQACDINEARRLYDGLIPLSPIMLALTASAPVFRGYLADIDCRWTVISQSVDCRTREERGLEPLKNSKYKINKSRYDSVDSYLSNNHFYKEKYNDIDLVYNTEYYEKLINEGVDKLMAKHVAHLFIRDPIVIFKELIEQDNSISTDHFENIQSTNWQTLRFKPPPHGSNTGWRIEFRPMEVQTTDFENAAFSIFIVLVTRAILSFDLNTYIPISKVDENMETAHKRDAVNKEMFFFRCQLFSHEQDSTKNREECPGEDEFKLMSIDEIINGKENGFYGLINIVKNYLNYMMIDVETRCHIEKYLLFISKRASGKLQTTAQFMRKFIHDHKDYKHDSVVTESINYDLIDTIKRITDGNLSLAKGFLDENLMNK